MKIQEFTNVEPLFWSSLTMKRGYQ